MHCNCIVVRLCCSDNLQMSAGGLQAWRMPRQSRASWPRPPLASKDTLTDSPVMRAHTRTHANAVGQTDAFVHAHFFSLWLCVCFSFCFESFYMCTHECNKRRLTWAPICASQAWMNTNKGLCTRACSHTRTHTQTDDRTWGEINIFSGNFSARAEELKHLSLSSTQ